jgi:dihydrodipicolinate synthase/N-acetylneuraminate lyase
LNIVGKTARQMFEAVKLENDAQRGLEIWKQILPIVHLYTHRQLGSVSDLAIYRSILNLWGLKGGFCRRPFLPLSAAQESTLRAQLERSGWIDPDGVFPSLSRHEPLHATARQS